MNEDIRAYNDALDDGDREIADLLAQTIDDHLPEAESKVWHRHPVWFLERNPTVGYSKQKKGLRLMFWSGAGFDEPGLTEIGGKFKDASIYYRTLDEVDLADVGRWLEKSKAIAWDYANIAKRKGVLERLR
ncbi:DUF1801 domain-containing protein [Pelagerythrobacter marensis]|uniref:DUF1801 domain-containing protein n=1 Tax=Pelagerythrobacter marensis TaxID=543877 RepID=A0ABZ2D4Z7_9SPHN